MLNYAIILCITNYGRGKDVKLLTAISALLLTSSVSSCLVSVDWLGRLAAIFILFTFGAVSLESDKRKVESLRLLKHLKVVIKLTSVPIHLIHRKLLLISY